LTEAAKNLETYGTNYRKVAEIQRSAQPHLGRGGFPMMGGRGGGQQAEPGTYLVKLTVGNRTYAGKVAVRLDPLQEAKGN
jgi:hypothetical protein